MLLAIRSSDSAPTPNPPSPDNASPLSFNKMRLYTGCVFFIVSALFLFDLLHDLFCKIIFFLFNAFTQFYAYKRLYGGFFLFQQIFHGYIRIFDKGLIDQTGFFYKLLNA